MPLRFVITAEKYINAKTEGTRKLTLAMQLLSIGVGAQVFGRVNQLVQLRLFLLQLPQDVLQYKAE